MTESGVMPRPEDRQPDLACPDHGNTLITGDGHLECCIKGCDYEIWLPWTA